MTWLRRVASALATLLVLTVAVAGTALARPAPASTAAEPETAKLTLVQQSSWVARNTAFDLAFEVQGAPPGAKLIIAIHEATASRRAFDAAVGQPDPSGADLGRTLDANIPAIPVEAFAANAQDQRLVPAHIMVQDGGTTAAGTVSLTQFGVHPVEVQLEAADGSRLARIVTHLVRLPDPSDQTKTVFAGLVVPFGAPPTLKPDGSRVLADRDRVRLQATANALVLHPTVPVTVAATPETLEGLAGTANLVDATSLDRLRRVAEKAQLLLEPYVSLDPSAWLASGLDNELSGQQLIGAKVTTDRLGTAPTATTQLVGRDFSATSLARATASSTRQLIIPDGALAPLAPNQLTRTLTRPFQVQSGPANSAAVQVDDGLQAAFSRHPDDPVLAAHELLAELAMVFNDDPTSIQGVVLVPPAGFQATPEFLTALLDGLQEGAPLVVPTSVDALFRLVPMAGRNGQAAGNDPVLLRPLTDRPVTPLRTYRKHLNDAEPLLGSLASMVGSNDRQVLDLGRQLLVSGSSQLSSTEQTQRIDNVAAIAARQLSLVQVPENQTVTLTSDRSSIPLTVRNNLNRRVTVEIELQANKRLDFPAGRVVTYSLDPISSTRLSIRTRTRGSGVSPVQITVRTPDGRVLHSTRYKVQSTAISGVGLIITIGAAAFLVLWWFSHWRQDRRRNRPRHAPGAGSRGEPELEPEPQLRPA